MTMTWADAERQFGAECVVAFDRDIAPQGWQAVLRVRGSDLAPELWADQEDCPVIGAGARWGSRCRCVMWNVVKWMTRQELQDLAMRAKSKAEKIEWLNEQFASGHVHFPQHREWRREYLGEWAPIESDAPDSE